MERWQWQGGQGLRVASGRPTPCYVLAPAKCTELRPSQEIWQGDPFRAPSPVPFSLLHTSTPSPLPPFIDTQSGGVELRQRVQTSLGVLSPLLSLCIFFVLISSCLHYCHMSQFYLSTIFASASNITNRNHVYIDVATPRAPSPVLNWEGRLIINELWWRNG